MSFSIKVNGDDILTSADNLTQLLAELKIDPSAVVVEKNYQILKKQDYDTVSVVQDDVFEIIRFMGGG